MKRIHLFELEDFPWFPNWLRNCLTRLIVVMHNMLGTPHELAQLVARALQYSSSPTIVDLCSGSGGPMLEVFATLKGPPQGANLTLLLTDLYPDEEVAAQLNNSHTPGLSYHLAPVNAAAVTAELVGVRTMVGSFHHMPPDIARRILANAQASQQPICIYEISDNSLPTLLWWIPLPMIFLISLFITPFARPLTWKQVIFTYLLPIIPICFAWDGAVSNARTYTLEDLNILISGLETENYTWEKGRLTGWANMLYLLGLPKP